MGGAWGWLVTVLAAAMVATAAAQDSGSGIPACASKLAPCVDYLNATKAPPASCCKPLNETLMMERDCLCKIYNDPALLQALQINITQILGLPKLCSIDIGKDPNALCKGQSPSSSSTESQSPPAGAGSGSGSASGSGGDKNAATTNKYTDIGLFCSLVVFCAYLMFY